MKKFFVVALAAMGMVACVQNEVVETPKSAAISFENTFVENATRAEDPSFVPTADNLDGFKVWAFMNQPDGIVFEAEEVTRNGADWTYNNTQYWMPGEQTYYFAALAPMNSTNWVVNTTNANTYGLGVVTFENVNGGEDLIYAATTKTTPKTLAEIQTWQDAKVALQFNHLLSKVKFTFKNGFLTDNVKVVVRNVKMDVPSKATIDLAVENWWDGDDWKLGTGTTTLEFGNTEEIKIGATNGKEAAKERLTIPAGSDYKYNISFDIDVYMGEQLGMTVNKTSIIEGIALEMGKGYNFTAEINPDNLELKPIEFTVTEVKDWDYSTPDTGFEVGSETVFVSTIDELQAALNAATGSNHDAVTRSGANVAAVYLAADLAGDVFIDQVEGVNLVIDGRGYKYDGTMYIHGNARYKDAETLTIKNVNFAHETGTIDFISSNSTESHERYAHNVTIENCTFTGNTNGDVVPMRFRQSYDIVVKDVTATNVHSLLWATGVSVLEIDNAKVTSSKQGISVGTTTNTVIKNSTIEATDAYGYGVRANASGAYTLTLINNEISAEVPVLLRKANNSAYTLKLEGNKLTTTKTYHIMACDDDYAADKTLDEPTAMPNIYGAYGENAYDIYPEPEQAADADDLVEALEAGDDVVLTADVKIDPAGMSNAYGTTGLNVKNGQTIDGGGNTLDIKGAGGTWDSGINTTGGLIKNITVTGSFRGIFINHNSTYSETVVLENVILDGTVYTISCDQGMNQNFEAYDSTFNGWTSYAATLGTAKFVNCNFGEGSGYAYCRPYAPTEFVGCAFEAGFTVNPRAAIVFDNCTLGGVALTSANIAELVSGDMTKVTVK